LAQNARRKLRTARWLQGQEPLFWACKPPIGLEVVLPLNGNGASLRWERLDTVFPWNAKETEN